MTRFMRGLVTASISIGSSWIVPIVLCSWAQGGIIVNPSFETTSGWTSTTRGAEYSAGYTSSWASDLTRSFEFRRGTGTVTAGNFAEISQVGIDLTNVTKLIFDCQDTGIDVVPLKFIVDDTTVIGQWQNNGWPGGNGTGWGNTAQTLGIEIPISSPFSGLHKLSIRMENDISHFPADPKRYRIDNLQAVPESSSMLLCLVFGILGFVVFQRTFLSKYCPSSCGLTVVA